MPESFQLDPFTLATDGVLRPVSDDPADGYCPGLFSLASGGAFYIPEPAGAKLADPYTGPNRFIEPFDRGYFVWKYGKNAKQPDDFAKQPEPERPEIVAEAVDAGAMAREERDARELQLYIAELTRELEAAGHRQALLTRLEENRVAAREALFLVLEHQRRRNQQIAAATAIRFFY